MEEEIEAQETIIANLEAEAARKRKAEEEAKGYKVQYDNLSLQIDEVRNHQPLNQQIQQTLQLHLPYPQVVLFGHVRQVQE